MLTDPRLIAIVTTIITLVFTSLIKKIFDKNFLVFKLDTEHKYEERKKVKDTLSKNKVHLLNACEQLNHRLLNLNENHNKKWHHVDGDYQSTGYYFISSIYRIAHVYAQIEIIEKNLIQLDTTIAPKEDLNFVKYLRVYRQVLSDLFLMKGIDGYDDSRETDHLMRGSVDSLARALIKDDGTICDADEFVEKKESYLPKLISICTFFDSISPEEERYRWDRLQTLHYLTLSFLNAYGYDFQVTDNKKFRKIMDHPRKNRILKNYVELLKRAKLGKQKEIRSFIKIAG